MMGMFTKISDSAGGEISRDGGIRKPYAPEDLERLERGTEACRRILVEAGADTESVETIPLIGGHPGGTAAIGRVVDADLRAHAAEGLYVCDASVFPRSPGRPPTLTLIALFDTDNVAPALQALVTLFASTVRALRSKVEPHTFVIAEAV